MRIAAYCVLGLFAFTLLLLWLRTRLRYRIGTRSLRVTLFGLSVRRIALVDIRYISKRRPRWGENWWNTLRPSHRVLTIQRHRGWFKNFVITPPNRYVFQVELEQAVQKAKAAQEAGGQKSRLDSEGVQNSAP
ncbi:MAG: hypothetical protein HY674_17720 [Chloroflexi bacterium]|nr:hypothetical protein [Chloroflexota bacterium]